MSVRGAHYVVKGIRFSETKALSFYNDGTWDAYESIHENYYSDDHKPNDLVMVSDTMSGAYVVLGFLVAKSDEDAGIPMTRVDRFTPNNLDDLVDRLETDFPDLAKAYEEERKAGRADVGIWVFTNHC